MRGLEGDFDDLASVAARFRRASGRAPVSFDITLGTEDEAAALPELTSATAKPHRPEVSQAVASILRDASERSRGKDVDVHASIAEERIIGRGDLQDLAYLEVGIAVARGVARIRIGRGSGSGALIGPRILMTNHHVIKRVSDVDVTACAEFDVQDDSEGRALPRQRFALDPSFFWLTSKELDFTLIGISEYSASGLPASNYPWLRISDADQHLADRDAITIIQHPLGGMKQIALRNNDVILTDAVPDFVHYTTDTQQGSSGSPCFDDLWRLVALHHSSVPASSAVGQILTRDNRLYRRGVDRAESIQWIANEGVRMSAIKAAISYAKLANEMERLRDDFLGNVKEPNPVTLARTVLSGTPSGADGPHVKTRKNRRMNERSGISIVVRILGDEIRGVQIEHADDDTAVSTTSTRLPATQASLTPPRQAPPPTSTSDAIQVEPPPDGAREAIVIDPDWAGRKGYDPDFLGVRLPLPSLNDEQKKITLRVPSTHLGVGDDPYVFRYHHYSLAFNKQRHIAWYSAAIVDGDLREHKYVREKDKWFYDERMDDKDNPIHQLGEQFYEAANTDRGHLTRYLDVQWGSTLDETQKATNDSFHFSNCSLQVAGFNQGKDRWQGIERFLLEKKARKEKRRMVVFTGPVLRTSDPFYRTSGMDRPVRIPLSFWKLAAIVPNDDRPLAVTAFILGQPEAAELDDVEELFDVTAVQVTVAKLARLTGLSFDKIVMDNDHFAKNGPGALEAVGLVRDEDIVV